MNVQLREAETKRHYTQSDRNELTRSWYVKTPEDFQTFRYIMRPKMLRARWQEDVAYHLMQVLPRTYCRQASKLIICAPSQHGKALALDTPIPTPNGWTTICELQVGDQVFDDTGACYNCVGHSYSHLINLDKINQDACGCLRRR